MDIGTHCAVGSCQQVDFLPFTCDCCASVFCLQHRSYDAHDCARAGAHDRRVVQCPLCQQMLRWTAEQDVNAVWDQHMRSGTCEPAATTSAVTAPGEKKKKKAKPRCGADRCREVLVVSNTFHCNACGLDVCLRHRFEGDHGCRDRQQQQRQQQRTGFLSRHGLGARHSTTTTTTTTNARAPSSSSAASARQAAAQVASGTRAAVTSLMDKGRAAVTAQSEQCPMCQQKFAYVAQLIAHVNRAHPDADGAARRPSSAAPSSSAVAAAVPSSSAREICPQCRTAFADVTALIAHVEQAHSNGGGRATASTGGGGGDPDKCSLM